MGRNVFILWWDGSIPERPYIEVRITLRIGATNVACLHLEPCSHAGHACLEALLWTGRFFWRACQLCGFLRHWSLQHHVLFWMGQEQSQSAAMSRETRLLDRRGGDRLTCWILLEEGPTLQCLAFMQRPWQVLKVEGRRSGTQKIPWRHGRKTFWDQVFSSVQWSLKQSIFWQTRMQVARLQWKIPIFGAKRLYLVAVFFLHIFSCWIWIPEELPAVHHWGPTKVSWPLCRTVLDQRCPWRICRECSSLLHES